MSKAPSQSADKFIIRMPEGLREVIKKHAEMNNRSMNAEIVACLSARYEPRDPHPKNPILEDLSVEDFQKLVFALESGLQRALLERNSPDDTTG